MGNPNPSPATRFGAGKSANPAGKTSEQKKLEYANAEAALRIRSRLLEAVERKLNPEGIDSEDMDARALEMVEAAMLKLLKDSEDRGLGTPVASINHRSDDGSMTPKTIMATMTPQEAAEAYASTLHPDKG